MLKRFVLRLFDYSYRINEDNFLHLLERNASAKLLDLGCSSGEFTLKCARRVGTRDAWGIEAIEERASEAGGRGIKVVRADLNQRLQLEDNSFDVITANQVIEHLINCDIFVEEIHRILKPSGYAVVSTENLSAWHNILALLLGYRPFSVQYSTKMNVGNPLSPHHMEEFGGPIIHARIFTYRALKELFQVYGFNIVSLVGAGYYPLPYKSLSRLFSKLDPRHAHFITIKVRK